MRRKSILFSWATEDFYTGRIAKLYTQGAQRVQKVRFWHTRSDTHRNQPRGSVGSMHWKIHVLVFSETEVSPWERRWKTVSSVCFLQCWASAWRSPSHILTIPSSLMQKAQLTLFPAPSAIPIGPCTVFTLQSQCANNHQPHRTCMRLLNAFSSSKYTTIQINWRWKARILQT